MVMLASALDARTVRAQTFWNDSTTRALVELATRLRAQQLADTGLTDYRADAHGYLTFLAQVGQGFTEPPRIVKADELALEVYWRAPNLSKQLIVGRRDTLLLPTDIAYHRDHLGIVQNNFPNIIRLGEGDEVRDVPHPLSPAGASAYDFAISDSLRIQSPGRIINVYEVKVRPKDDRQPRVIGAVYIDRSEGQVVRMALSFTRAAFIDTQLEDLSIVLENRLVAARFWLPSRQEIEIRRTGTWMDYPVRGIIRGRWEISEYRINQGLSYSIFGGPEIVQAPVSTQQRYMWPTRRVLDSLPPDVRAVTDADVRRVQAEARALVRAQALQRSRTLALSARGISDLVRVNRVEGLAVGGGLTQRLGGGISATGRVRYGIDDRDVKWQARLERQSGGGTGVTLRVFAQRDFRELGDESERSRAVNSLAAQEFGSDDSDPYGVAGGGLAIERAPPGGASWRLEVAGERAFPLAIHSSPVSGAFRGLVDVPSSPYARITLRAERPTSLWFFGTELRASAELRALHRETSANVICAPGPVSVFNCRRGFSTLRGSLSAAVERPIGRQRLVLRSFAAAVGAKVDVVAPQELIYLGGPVSAPGYPFHSFVARAAASERLEWRLPIPFVAIPLGRFGSTPASATIAPYAAFLAVRVERDADVRRSGVVVMPPVSGGYPSVGVGFLTLFDLLRLDVARGLRDGRWMFSVDVSSEFWGVL